MDDGRETAAVAHLDEDAGVWSRPRRRASRIEYYPASPAPAEETLFRAHRYVTASWYGTAEHAGVARRISRTRSVWLPVPLRDGSVMRVDPDAIPQFNPASPRACRECVRRAAVENG